MSVGSTRTLIKSQDIFLPPEKKSTADVKVDTIAGFYLTIFFLVIEKVWRTDWIIVFITKTYFVSLCIWYIKRLKAY